ncbi:hypothetical protein VP1G_09712 [Cytospora mali]|uniref:Uncharacterized protein n=1 Tax=Cytospora mali TaxID=578113 RepID=A0A194VFC4_CYTMA|nr:hypothetical protein VP1G_09712 [Valsa mali var. pyri (nom. inval.)]
MAVLKGFVLETCSGLAQEIRAVKEGIATKEELYAIRQELHTTKEQLRTTKEELYATKGELHANMEELQVSDEVYGLAEDEVDHLLDQTKMNIKEELVEEPTREQKYCLNQAINEFDFYTVGEVDGQLTEMQQRLTRLQERCIGLDQAIEQLDVYTNGEVEERLDQVERHCEGINNLETEEMVLGAKVN